MCPSIILQDSGVHPKIIRPGILDLDFVFFTVKGGYEKN